MKLLIDISEDAYACAKNGTFDANYSPYTILDYISRGVLVPKDSRLIDAVQLEKDILSDFAGKLNDHDANLMISFMNYIDDASTIGHKGE